MVLAAAAFGTLGPIARAANEVGFSAVSFAVWRAAVSLVALVVLLAVAVRAGWVRPTPWSAVSHLERLQLVAMGAFVGGTTLTLFAAFERTTIALTLIVLYTFPVIVAIAAVPLYGEHLGWRRSLAIGLAMLGLTMVVISPGAGEADAGLDLLGVLLALGAAGCQAGYALVASRGFASVPPLQAATVLRAFATLMYAVFVVPFVLLIGEASTLSDPLTSGEAWGLVLIAGVLGAALPTAMLVAGYRRVGPTRGAVLMLVEPVTGVLLAALLLAEQPAPSQLLGGLLVLVGAALVQLTPSTRPGPKPVATAE